MSILSRLATVLALCAVIALARADGINNPAVNGNGNSIDFIGGVNNLGIGGSVNVGTCTGTLDGTTGCPMPPVGI